MLPEKPKKKQVKTKFKFKSQSRITDSKVQTQNGDYNTAQTYCTWSSLGII